MPATFIGNNYIQGYDATKLNELIEKCNIEPCPTPQSIVDEYYKNNPEPENNTNSSNTTSDTTKQTYVGWGILLLCLGGIIVVVVVQFRKQKNKGANEQ